jgi:hypothetical protein
MEKFWYVLVMYHMLHLCQKIVQYMLYCLFECDDGMNHLKSASLISQALLDPFNMFTAVAVCVCVFFFLLGNSVSIPQLWFCSRKLTMIMKGGQYSEDDFRSKSMGTLLMLFLHKSTW